LTGEEVKARGRVASAVATTTATAAPKVSGARCGVEWADAVAGGEMTALLRAPAFDDMGLLSEPPDDVVEERMVPGTCVILTGTCICGGGDATDTPRVENRAMGFGSGTGPFGEGEGEGDAEGE
jgi:hypothetical protein